MIDIRPMRLALACAALAASVLPWSAALAQGGPAVPFAGFSSDSDEPIQIEADELEVFDREQRAVFQGNVEVVQGNVNLTSTSLVVFYTGEAAPGAAPAEPAADGAPQQQIRRIEADGGVILTSEDQQATGDSAVYEAETEIVTMTGNVVLSQGDNVLRGDRLIVDLASGRSRVESDGGRVQGLFAPGSGGPAGN